MNNKNFIENSDHILDKQIRDLDVSIRGVEGKISNRKLDRIKILLEKHPDIFINRLRTLMQE